MTFVTKPLAPIRRFAARAYHAWRRRNLVPGWTSFEEQSYFQRYAREVYTGAGEIVDLGSLLGSTTIPLAAGLEKNRLVQRKEGRVHAYDLFEWQPWMSGPTGGFKRTYAVGESFLGEFKERIGRHAAKIAIYPGDLMQICWRHGPIEFLLVDANKSWELSDHIYRAFYPHLIVRDSLVLEQDFKHFYTPWIHIQWFRLRDRVRREQDIVNSCSVVFRVLKALGPEVAPLPDPKETSAAELDEVYSHSLSLLREGAPWEKGNVIASKVMFYLHLDKLSEARAAFEEALSQGYSLSSDLGTVQQMLEEKEDALQGKERLP